MSLSDVTVLIVNWKTPDLLAICVETFLKFYPKVELILVDNDSRDGSPKYISDLVFANANVSAILNRGHRLAGVPFERFPRLEIRQVLGSQTVVGLLHTGQPISMKEKVMRELWGDGNIGHGPGLHLGLTAMRTPFALALDSDCEILRGGFIEAMMQPFSEDSSVYAVGRKIHLGSSGAHTKPGRGHDHIHPSIVMLDVAKYRTLLPFVLSGVPAKINMPDALRKGYRLADFPIGGPDSAIHHRFLGSRKRFKRIPKMRSLAIMPEVFLWGLKTQYIGEYFAGLLKLGGER